MRAVSEGGVSRHCGCWACGLPRHGSVPDVHHPSSCHVEKSVVWTCKDSSLVADLVLRCKELMAGLCGWKVTQGNSFFVLFPLGSDLPEEDTEQRWIWFEGNLQSATFEGRMSLGLSDQNSQHQVHFRNSWGDLRCVTSLGAVSLLRVLTTLATKPR